MNFTQTVAVSFQSLKNNKLRTMLTVLGVVVGIFSIIVIMTIISMLQTSIENGVSQLNKNTFQIQKFPAMHGGGPGQRSKYRNRKDLTMEEFERLEKLLTQAKHIGAEQWQFGKIVKYGNKETNPNIQVAGITVGALATNNWNVEYGRTIRSTDVRYSNDVCIIGKDIVDKLFMSINPIGQI